MTAAAVLDQVPELRARLTRREQGAVERRLRDRGYSATAIADGLGITERPVQRHRATCRAAA